MLLPLIWYIVDVNTHLQSCMVVIKSSDGFEQCTTKIDSV